MIDVLQQIRNGCVPRRPTPQKKALATADLVRDSLTKQIIREIPHGADSVRNDGHRAERWLVGKLESGVGVGQEAILGKYEDFR